MKLCNNLATWAFPNADECDDLSQVSGTASRVRAGFPAMITTSLRSSILRLVFQGENENNSQYCSTEREN